MSTIKETFGMEPIFHSEDDSYTPSKSVIAMMGAKKKWFEPKEYPKPSTSGKKVLVLAVDEKYILCQNGKKYRGGNHPVELFAVVKHLADAGFEIVYSTISGGSVELEEFAMPTEDELLMQYIETERPKWENPKVLKDVVTELTEDSAYEAVYMPGGQGAILGLPESEDAKAALQWFLQNDKYMIAICHGPSALLSLSINEDPENFPLKDYKISCFPAIGDKGAAKVGYLPGEMPWFFDEKLKDLGMHNVSPLGMGVTHIDRKLISGDNPFVANKLGNIAAEKLLADDTI